MPKANKLYAQFNKGLITEASPLTFPEGTTSSELNMMLFQSGNRPRRYGLNYTSPQATGITTANFANYAVSEYKWISANNSAGSDFIAVQIGTTIFLYTLAGVAVSSVDMSSYIISGITTATAAATYLSFASGNGFLFVAGKYTEPVVISWDGTNFASKKLFVLIRDFIGVDDGLGPDVEPTTLSNPHKYNLQNQGWLVGYNIQDGPSVTIWTAFGDQTTQLTSAASVIDTYHTDVGRYPANSKLWWWAQKAGFNIDSGSLANLPAGNILAPKGHYVVNAFNIDRSAVSAVSGITVETISERPSTVAYFAGRVWYGCQSTVYYSRVLDANKFYKANFCCMEADPTSQKISDLIATDGGEILIPDIGSIIKLYAVGSGMLVFGTNGVWFIQGGNGAFSAIDFSVSKMSPIGMDAPMSVIEVDAQIFWMSYLGIQGMSQKNGIFGPIQGNFDKLNITQNTIQSYYTENFPPSIRKYVKAINDPASNTVQWLFASPGNISNFYDSILCLDLNLQAFYPWKFSASGPYVIGAYSAQTPTLVVKGSNTRPTQTVYLSYVPIAGNVSLGFAQTTDTTFVDWKTYDSVGVTYLSFLESGYEILQDAERKKWLPYIFTYLRQTETGVTTSDGGATYQPVNTSSCTMTIKWDWTNASLAGKWSTPVEIYVIDRIQAIDSTAPAFVTGSIIVKRKNKIRGSGKALQFRFECSQANKDFDLVGWATEYTGGSTP